MMPHHDTSAEPTKESRGRTSRRLIQSLAIVSIAGAALTLQYWLRVGKSNSSSSVSDSKALGKRCTFLKLEALTDPSQEISPDTLKGKVTLVNFWGPWCVQCRVEMPFLDELRRRTLVEHPADFAFVSVSCGPEMTTESLEELKSPTIEYLHSVGMKFPVCWDPQGQTRLALLETAELSDQGLLYPLNVLLDGDGIICGFWMGSSDSIEKEIQASVERELAKRNA